ncbi:peptidoglycan DD-metalloendopeptidase family protein [Candidatus Peregrinibacteria bacterium]|nr:peptidoglycan DD-metalloendopeptidase family protein [Candidatus Peregrinibacteria bacterium]
MRPLGKKQELLLVGLCFVLTFFVHGSILYAQEGSDWIVSQSDEQLDNEEKAAIDQAEKDFEEPEGNPTVFKDFREDSPYVEDNWKEERRQIFLDNIKAEIRGSEKELSDVNANMKETNDRLDNVHEEITTLSEQIAIFDEKITTTEQLILNVAAQVAQKENEIILLYEEIDLKNAAISHQKKILSEYLRALYMRESAISNTMVQNSEVNIAKLLLSDEPVGTQLQQITYFNLLEEQGLELFHQLETMVTELEKSKELAKVAKVKLARLYAKLDEEREQLEVQREAKQQLLEVTRGEEEIYKNLIAETQEQQNQLQEDLRELRDNLTFIQDEMRVLGDAFDPNDYRDLFSGEKTSIYAYINAFKDDVDGFRLHWPVTPARGISAYFRDAAYVGVFGVQHNAVDIPTKQNTTVRAPAEGVVYKVRDNGYGYSYLILAHKGGFMTVYGHVSGFLVEPGEKVRAGQAVALSGGTPGTKGAGYMTTGAHLHFEVMKDGSYTDPLFYLPLSELDYASLPQKYKDIADSQELKVARESESEVEDLPSEEEVRQQAEAARSGDSAETQDASPGQKIPRGEE